MKRVCPKCRSYDVETERRPDGNSRCTSCGFVNKTSLFGIEYLYSGCKVISEELEDFKNDVKRFDSTKFIEYLTISKSFGKVNSEYTRGLHNGIELALCYLENRDPSFIKFEEYKEE